VDEQRCIKPIDVNPRSAPADKSDGSSGWNAIRRKSTLANPDIGCHEIWTVQQIQRAEGTSDIFIHKQSRPCQVGVQAVPLIRSFERLHRDVLKALDRRRGVFEI
jgi:hypothetical protein